MHSVSGEVVWIGFEVMVGCDLCFCGGIAILELYGWCRGWYDAYGFLELNVLFVL